MNSIEIILLNFSETRRRSINLWKGIPDQYLDWRPDNDAFSILEMIRHVLESEHLFHTIIKNRGNLGDYPSPWNNLPYNGLETELEFARKYRDEFIKEAKGYSESDLEEIRIERSEVGQSKTLGDYLMRIGYHESVHTGQMLDYLRTAGIDRPQVWD